MFTDYICKVELVLLKQGRHVLEILREKIALPQQLQYTDPLTNEIVTELFVTDYTEYLATKCEVMQRTHNKMVR